MSDFLPQEVVIEILSRLPVKSLVRFRCVSKSWDSLITSPMFITTHLCRNTLLTERIPMLLLRLCPKYKKQNESYSLHFDDESFSLQSEFELPFNSESRFFQFIGSSNGVVCLLNDLIYIGNPILWNPSTRKSLKLPPPTFPCHRSSSLYLAVVGFGFDVESNDYKVLRIVNVRREFRMTKISKSPIKVELYSLNAGFWKVIDASLEPFALNFSNVWNRRNQACVNGIVHWLVCRENQNFVLSFDMRSELFKEILLPKSLATKLLDDVSISVFENSLAMFYLNGRNCDIWVMGEYGLAESWTIKFVIYVGGLLERPLAFRKNGEILMATRYGEVVSYNPQKLRILNLGIFGLSHFSYVEPYVESLVLLNKANEMKSDKVASKKRKERLPDSVAVGTSNKVSDPGDKVVGTRNQEAVLADMDMVADNSAMLKPSPTLKVGDAMTKTHLDSVDDASLTTCAIKRLSLPKSR